MPWLDKRHQPLTLSDDCIKDPLLMALAWKKSHQYIRTANWYADNFDLDFSALSLVENSKKWAADIQKSDLIFTPLELVPAPKACLWEFKESSFFESDECVVWSPVALEDVQLRPLAHIAIREQTMMTLVMMCLADKVETLQGDPATEYEKVHETGVVSYGNRLFCRYDDGKAVHSYGATTSYSKYFTDYQRFLERPYYFAQQASNEQDDEQEIFLVELDFSKFFDLVNRDLLVEKINFFAEEFSLEKRKSLNHLLAAFKQWQWTREAKSKFEEVCKSDKVATAPLGLPQGLVAAGFLANVYLLEFDALLKEKIGKTLDESEPPVKLIDYCRYVDDMRLVISAPKNNVENQIKQVKQIVQNIIEGLLGETKLGLIINPDKTKVSVYRGRANGISRELKKIQTRLSGPISFDEANEQLGQLESLLSLTDTNFQQTSDSECRINKLAQIEKSKIDVRDDSLKRFATNKIAKILKEIRHFTAHDINNNGQPIPGDWDYQQERIARRLIACWSRDPSLVVLLKKGLELFPCSWLLTPVIEQLNARLDDINPKVQAVARYCLSEIFRHAATVIHRKDKADIPVHADTDTFFETLQCLAVKLSKPEDREVQPFDLLAEQARFLLMVRLDTSLETSSGKVEYDLIFKLISGFKAIKLPALLDLGKIASCILLAAQLTNETKPIIRSVANLFSSDEFVSSIEILKKLAYQNMSLFRSLILYARAMSYEWVKNADVKKLISQHALDQKPLLKKLDEISGKQSLLRLIRRIDNPFANELMALKLMEALLNDETLAQKIDANLLIDLSKTKIEFFGYANPPKFSAFDNELNIFVELELLTHELSFHLQTDVKDTLILQRIAMCLRAVLISNNDWTEFGRKIEPKIGYRGIKTSSDKRSFGLLTTPYSIGGEAVQVSQWLTTLISKLLIWPGAFVNDQGYIWPTEWTVATVQKLVSNRLDELRHKYCKQSGMPGLTQKVHLEWSETKNNLTVAMVQSKLPAKKDFGEYGLLLDDPEYRSKHRQHIAAVASLVCKHIQAQQTGALKAKNNNRNIDLIVWPELAVHESDLDILIALSRKTSAIIFSGLTFIKQPEIPGPNNCAIWIVPSRKNSEQKELMMYQGKQNMMADELGKVVPWRPYQLMLELVHPQFPNKPGFILTGSICYDATDIALSADLRDKSNAYVISALNQDVNTFDSMVDALHYHMYQPVILVNTGEFGGSYAKAPYKEPHHRLIAHSHGNDQVSINTFEMNMFDFRRDNVGESLRSDKNRKTIPAGITKKSD